MPTKTLVRRDGSRTIDELLLDHGTHLPRREVVPPPPPEVPLFPKVIPANGRRAPGHGWAPTRPNLAGYEMTSEQTPVMWPLIAGDGLPPWGAEMGYNVLSGGKFYFDPLGWVNDDSIPVTNTNVFQYGMPGYGKSSIVKIAILRLIPFGYRGLILGDVSNEYEALCEALDCPPHKIGPGLAGRLNPLDPGPLGDGWDRLPPAEQRRRVGVIFSRWLMLMRGLVTSQGVDYTPTEDQVLTRILEDLAGVGGDGCRYLRPVVVPQVWQVLRDPSEKLVEDCRYASRQDFWEQTRGLRDALGSLCTGALRGMFDAESTIHPDWQAPIQSLSLKALYDTKNDAATGIALMCLSSWGRGMRELAPAGDHVLSVRDETWFQTRLGLGAVANLDADLRTSRKDGDLQWVVFHKPSDPLSAGDVGSQAYNIAKDMANLASTRILMAQDEEVGEELGSMFGLSEMQQQVVTRWSKQAKGRGLWLVGDRKYKVQTYLTPVEKVLTYTNKAIA